MSGPERAGGGRGGGEEVKQLAHWLVRCFHEDKFLAHFRVDAASEVEVKARLREWFERANTLKNSRRED